MRALLHDPITGDEAYALNDVVHRRHKYCDMIAWLSNEPVSWNGYFMREAFREEEADRLNTEYWRKKSEEKPQDSVCTAEEAECRRQYLAGAKAEYMKFASPCPNCGTPPEFLEWYLHGGALLTRCRFCLQQVNEFTLMLGTGIRALNRPPELKRGKDNSGM